jgi:hypothetical protein
VDSTAVKAVDSMAVKAVDSMAEAVEATAEVAKANR